MFNLHSNLRTHLAIGALAVLIIALLPSITFASTSKAVVDEFRLTKTKGSPINIPNFKAKIYSDGSIKLSGKGEYAVGGPTMILQYEVDIKNKQYTTKKVDPSFINNDKLLHQQQTERVNLEPRALKLYNKLNEGNPQHSINTGHWRASVRVRTFDALLITLTETSNELTWYVYSNGTVCWTGYRLRWYAVNPSPFDTHWFIDDTQHYGPYPFANYTQAYHRMNGDYHNYDWGFDSWQTTVHQTASITARNDAMFNYSWDHIDDGEDSEFIWGSVILN